MLINSYNFGKPAGSNTAALIQNTASFTLNNGAGNSDSFVMSSVKVGSTLIIVVHYMMLNGNNPAAIISDNRQATGYATQGAKCTAGASAGANHKGSIEIHKSDVFQASDFGGASSGDVKIFTKCTDQSAANIRMHYYGVEVANLANGDVTATTEWFPANTGTVNAGNSSPNVALPSGWSQKNTFILAAATGMVSSFNTCTYPATSHGGPAWNTLWIKDEATSSGTGNARSIANYVISSSNAATLISDWGTTFSGTPWAALIIAFKSS